MLGYHQFGNPFYREIKYNIIKFLYCTNRGLVALPLKFLKALIVVAMVNTDKITQHYEECIKCLGSRPALHLFKFFLVFDQLD